MKRNLLRSRMAAAGYNQAKLAARIGISENTLSAKINEKRPFDVTEIDRICEALNIFSGKEKAEIFLSNLSQNRDITEFEMKEEQ